ncbi:MAG TPA: hypothetical protein VGC25_09465 [Alphaproteobacteria bacterium]|jgi:hypothetical protein
MIFGGISRWVIERSVDRGARYLDRINPGWDRNIDLGDFSIGSYRRCVLGQLHPGGYQEGVAVLGLSAREAWHCGFDLFPLARWPSWRLFGTRSGFDYLNACWKRLIQERRQTA